MKKANMMKEAHKLAKTYVGNYSACLALALRTIAALEKKFSERAEKWFDDDKRNLCVELEKAGLTERAQDPEYKMYKMDVIKAGVKSNIQNLKFWSKGNTARLYFDKYIETVFVGQGYVTV